MGHPITQSLPYYWYPKHYKYCSAWIITFTKLHQTIPGKPSFGIYIEMLSISILLVWQEQEIIIQSQLFLNCKLVSELAVVVEQITFIFQYNNNTQNMSACHKNTSKDLYRSSIKISGPACLSILLLVWHRLWIWNLYPSQTMSTA